MFSHSTLKKLIMELKIAFFIIVTGVSSVFATPVYSQLTKVTLDMKNMSLEQVMDEIEKQSEFYFIFNQKQIDAKRIVDIQANNKLITDILADLFIGTHVNYTVLDRKILLTTDPPEKSLSAIASGTILQQNRIAGTVTGKDGSPLPGVNVVVTGTTQGMITDISGKYSIDVPPGSKSLTFSFIGMEPQVINIGTLTQINVTLTESAIGLDEVVVIGYGTQKKVNVIGSVTTVSVKEITTAPVSSVSTALAGRLPGAVIQQRSGEPGGDAASILIRGIGTLGNSSPLIVVDGITGRDLNSINPGDIESVTILKDASAAIYGARAANGVVLVTTQRGKEGASPNFNYSFYVGLLSPTHLPEMADAATYAQMLREMETYKGVAESNMSFSLEDIEKFKSGKYPWTHPNTNWWDATLKNNSQTRNHDFSVSGGTKMVNYFVSYGSQYADGLYKNSSTSFNRYNLRANVDVQLNKLLSLSIDLDGSQENRMGSPAGAGLIFNVTNQNKPTYTAFFPNGFPGTGAFGSSYNPALICTFQAGFDDDKRYRSNNKIGATLKIPGVEGLSLSSYFAYDVFFGKRKVFDKPVTGYTLDEAAYFAAGNTGSEDGSAFLIPTSDNYDPRLTNYYDNSGVKTFNIKLNYDKTINNVHNISAFVAYESLESNGSGISAYRRYFISDQLPYFFAGGDSEKDNSEYVNLDSRINYFGRVSYNYKGTYLLQFALRRDGSLRFSKESGRWGSFPSVLAGWIASNENFWKDRVKFMSFLKLKASWGQLGNDLVSPFQYLTSFEFGTGGVYGGDRVYASSLTQSNVPNPAITWEVANTYNAGFESKYFNNRLSFNTDLFYQRRDKILVQRNASVPSFSGITLPDENFGIVDSKGLEIELGYDERQLNFSYGIIGNFAFARNKIIEYDEPERSVPWQVRTGHPIGSALLYKSAGIFRDWEQVNSSPHVTGAMPGDVIIVDTNGDNKISSDDRILFDKTTNPEITFGLSLNFRYKSVALSGLIYGTGIAWVRRLGSQQGTAGDYYQFSADGRWTPDNIDATKPRAYDGSRTYWRGSYATDMEYQDQSYARMKNIQLSYTFPKRLLDVIYLKDAQIYISGQNLFLIYASKNRIWDPEFSGDRDNYPLMKVMSVGAKVSF